jgi:hypothetical protein
MKNPTDKPQFWFWIVFYNIKSLFSGRLFNRRKQVKFIAEFLVKHPETFNNKENQSFDDKARELFSYHILSDRDLYERYVTTYTLTKEDLIELIPLSPVERDKNPLWIKRQRTWLIIKNILLFIFIVLIIALVFKIKSKI